MLIVTELYYPEDTSTGYFLTGIAEGLAAAGLEVQVVCAQPSYRRKGIQVAEREVRHGVDIFRVAVPSGSKDNLVQRVWLATVLSWRFHRALRRFMRRHDSILVVTNPPTLPMLVGFVRDHAQTSKMLLVHDVYPDVLVPAGVIKRDGLLYRALDGLQRRTLSRFRRVIVLGRDMEALIAGKLPGMSERLAIIPNWGDVEEIRPCLRQGNPLREHLGLQGKFIIQFSGNLGRTHGLDDLLALARRLSSEPDYHFLVYGWGAGRACIERELATGGLKNLTLLDPCERDQLGIYLTACDLFLLPFRAGMEGISVPSRVYNVMAAGNAVLAVAGESSELARIVLEEEIGWVVSPGDIEAMAVAVRAAAADEDSLERMRARARSAAEKKYSRAQVIAGFSALLGDVAATDA